MKQGFFRGAFVFVVLTGWAFFVGRPLVTKNLQGTGEAYNYCLAMMDFVEHARDGQLPVLVGETEYAFNGRIHPLRNGPLFFHLAAVVDSLTLRKLGGPALQNLTLGLCLEAAALVMYYSLRRITRSNRLLATVLALLYITSPAYLVGLYGLNLFMTMCATPLMPAALGLALLAFRTDGVLKTLQAAAALGALWWAHPPTAAWMTLLILFLRIAFWLRRPSAQGVRYSILFAAGLLVFGAFEFASVGSLAREGSINVGGDADHGTYVSGIVAVVRGDWPMSIIPLSWLGQHPLVMQLGYSGFLLLGIGLYRTKFRRVRLDEDHLIETALLISASVFVVLCLPIPGLTLLLWKLMPTPIIVVNNAWAMQRLYLPALLCILFATSLRLTREYATTSKVQRNIWVAVFVLLLSWNLFEAQPVLRRGMDSDQGPALTEKVFRLSNIDLTLTSFAFLGTPDAFVHGYIDPRLNFSWENGAGSPGASLTDDAVNVSSLIEDKPLAYINPKLYEAQFHLAPNRKYLLVFRFKGDAAEGSIELTGPLSHRSYNLPEAGNIKGFGMLAGNSHVLPITTEATAGEDVKVRALLVTPRVGDPGGFATVELREYDALKIPVFVRSFRPLKLSVESGPGREILVTPRRFLKGYSVTLNGRPGQTYRTNDGNLAVPVPAGHSEIEIVYAAPWWVKTAWWMNIAAFGGIILVSPRALKKRARVLIAKITSAPRERHGGRSRTAVLVGAAAVAVVAWVVYGATLPRAEGVTTIEFFLPKGSAGTIEPIAAYRSSDTLVCIKYLDEDLFEIGAAVDGRFYWSQSLHLDRSVAHLLTLTRPILFAQNQAMPVKIGLRLELDGAIVLENPTGHVDLEREPELGRTASGFGTDLAFTGSIVRVKRRAWDAPIRLTSRDALEIVFRHEIPAGAKWPLATVAFEGRIVCCGVGRDDARLPFLEILSTDPKLNRRVMLEEGVISHRIVLGCVRTYGEKVQLRLSIDDKVQTDAPLIESSEPALAWVGVAGNQFPGVSSRVPWRIDARIVAHESNDAR